MKSVAITGMGAVSAIGNSIAETAVSLAEGRSGIGPVTLFDSSPYPSRIAAEVHGLPEVAGAGRGTALLFKAMGEALSTSGLSAPVKADLVLGTTLGGMERGTSYMRGLLSKGGIANPAILDDFLPSCQIKRCAAAFGLRGAGEIVSNACSSGTDAIGLGFERVRRGISDRVIAGGYDPLCEFVFAGFNSLLVTAKSACRPFDRDREGMVIGEGAAVVVLESAESARARGAAILGYVRGFGAAADAFHLTQPSPDGRGIAAATAAALSSAGLGPASIDYINLHGTATQYNDVSEYRGLAAAFGDALRGAAASSTKAMTGHALGGAGALEAVFCALSLSSGVVPPNLNLRNQAPGTEGLSLSTEPGAVRRMRYALSDSVGFGGECGCLVLERGGGDG